MTFRRSMKVVCVDAENYGGYLPLFLRIRDRVGDMDGLTEGAIYTVADCIDWFGAPMLLLAEIQRPLAGKSPFYAPGFMAARFRPVVDRKFDLSIFTKLLSPEKVTA